MKIHPWLQDPHAVAIYRHGLPGDGRAARWQPEGDGVTWADFRQAARQVMTALQVELEGERVVIKPNATSAERFANPDTGITTHPGFVHGLVEFLGEHGVQGSRVVIAEDPRNTDDNLPRHWLNTGFERVAQETGARLHCPTSYTCVKKTVPQPLVFPRLSVSRLAAAPGSLLFNVPKLKTHNLAITTLCMKNLMGLVYVLDRHYCAQAWKELPPEVQRDPRPRMEWLEADMHTRWQEGLARRLADTAQVLRPALNLVEGIVGREGTGFQRGRNRALGLVIAGVNMVAVDSVASALMGFDPQRLVYLRVAAEAGLGSNDLKQLQIYTVDEAGLKPCRELDALRLAPPFRVIRGIKGEAAELFDELTGSHLVDPTMGSPVWS